MKQSTRTKIGILLLLASLVACSDSSDDQVPQARNAIQDAVLATVNGDTITQNDVDFLLARTFSNAAQFSTDEVLQAKILKSLVAAKAMQQAMQKVLSVDAQTALANKVKAYQEELYVKEYLLKHATPEPVSTLMVKNYYQNHLQEFGGIQQRKFEMLKASRKPSEQQRDALLAQISSIKRNQDWATFASTSKLKLSYQTSTMQPGLLEKPLEDELLRLAKGQSSDVVLFKGIPHVVRVIEITQLTARPLSAVSADIRKKLATFKLKKAVKEASDAAINQAEVRYN